MYVSISGRIRYRIYSSCGGRGQQHDIYSDVPISFLYSHSTLPVHGARLLCTNYISYISTTQQMASVTSPPAAKSAHTQSDFCQILPNGPVTAETYILHLRDFHSRLSKLCGSFPGHLVRCFGPYPIYAAPHRAIEMQKSCALAQTAFTAIIQQWWSTPRFQSYIPLPPKIERTLRKLDLIRPYDSVGVIRTDILIPEEESGASRICEINARFIFNGFFPAALGGQESQRWDFCADVGNFMTIVWYQPE